MEWWCGCPRKVESASNYSLLKKNARFAPSAGYEEMKTFDLERLTRWSNTEKDGGTNNVDDEPHNNYNIILILGRNGEYYFSLFLTFTPKTLTTPTTGWSSVRLTSAKEEMHVRPYMKFPFSKLFPHQSETTKASFILNLKYNPVREKSCVPVAGLIWPTGR